MYFCSGCDKDHSDDIICHKDIYKRRSYNSMPWRLQIAAQLLAQTIGYTNSDVDKALELADKLIRVHEVTSK